MSIENSIEKNRHLIGISNTYMKDRGWLEHAADDIHEILSDVKKLIIIPYALGDMDWYSQKLTSVFLQMGVKSVDSVHRHCGDENLVIEDAEAIYIGGGNTGRLVANLHGLRHVDGTLVDGRQNASQVPLVSVIRKRVGDGMPLFGASAGFNVMSQDIRTTNDMHIAVQKQLNGVFVSRLDALGVLPPHLSVNPHYLEKIAVSNADRERAIAINQDLGKVIDHQGESRETRLKEVIEMDPARKILALREGAYIVVNGESMALKGETGALIFESNKEPIEIASGANLDYLLTQSNNRSSD